MDAIVGVWLSSIVGAGAFAAAGYVLGTRGVIVPFLQPPAPAPAPLPIALTPQAPPVFTPSASLPPVTPVTSIPPVVSGPPPPLSSSPISAAPASLAPVSSRPTLAPPDPAAVAHEDRPTPVPPQTNAELLDALARAEAESQRAKAAEIVKVELERQLETLRSELRHELVARSNAESRAEELGDRLAKASEEASSLRHQVTVLDKQVRQLRDALQGRVRALTTSEWHHRSALEETEDLRTKLRDAYDRIERTSLPPEAPRSLPPRTTELPVSGARGDDPAVLKGEIVRLTQENRALRARALGNLPPKSSRASAPDIDLTLYQTLMERIGTVAGLKGAAVTDETGSLIVGHGEFAEGLAAFGAYIRDAGSRTDRLLPLEALEEIDIRDRAGMYLMTRVVTRAPTELSLVVLGSAEASIAATKNIVIEVLPPR